MEQEQKLDTSSTVSTGENAPSDTATPRTVCRTVTLTDEPEETDAFSGPHQRIANAVAQLIQPEDAKGISIGIEGSWGSGKSTVARLLTKQLETDKNIAVVSFDAWAHEGDPLRRTFLETIIRNLKDRGWVKRETWDERIEELANRREVVTTKDKLTISPAGWLIAFVLLLVPIGGAFITAALRLDITVAVLGTPHWKFLIYILIGLALTFIPLLVLFLKVKHEPDIVAFLFNKGPTERTTETSKTANPTSIEFEDNFQKLFTEALEEDPLSKEPPKKDKRRVVLILDNLDRVDSKDALIIWSTLQTFLQHKVTSRPNSHERLWHERLWLLVLYDINGLSKLWKNENEAAISFIDKSFQIRFEVPALVLSDWRQFLMTQLVKAFPAHIKFESDFHEVYRVLAIWIAKRKQHLTIRELKLFVNQIGSVHRQWAGADPASDTFPLALIAYYALLRRDGKSIVDSLFDQGFPEKEYQEILGSTARENLAALAFNVEVDVAQQLLFGDKIINALTLGEKDELSRVASLLRRGFWEVFEEVAKNWAGGESVKVADAALAIEESGILSSGFGPSVRSVTKCFCDRAASVGAWSPMDTKRAKGIAILLKWKKELSTAVQNEYFLDTVSRALATGLIAGGVKLSAKGWLDYLNVMLNELESVPQQRALTAIVNTLSTRFQSGEVLAPFQVELMLEVLCDLHERSELTGTIEKYLRELADTGKLGAQLRSDLAHNAVSAAWATYVLVRYSSTFDQVPLPGGKEEREKQFSAICTDQMVHSFVEILKTYKDTSLLFDVVKTAPELKPLIVASLRIVLNNDYAGELFVTDEALERLEFVSRELGPDKEAEARLLALISQVPRQVDLAKEFTSRPFMLANANLYLLVLKAGGRDQKEFVTWCINGLRSVVSTMWSHELRNRNSLLTLAFYLDDLGVEVGLGAKYFHALSGLLNTRDWEFVGNDRENLAALLGPPESPSRAAFQYDLEELIRGDKKLPDWFFAVFGLELKIWLLDSSRGAKIVELLPLIFKHEHTGGLIWLRDTLSEAGKTLDSQYSNDAAWKEFKNSVRRALIAQPSGTQTLVNSMANILSIRAPQNGVIAFATPEQDKICTLDPNNLETKVLIKDALPNYGRVSDPSWSPDGKKLAYAGTSEPSGKSEIFILDYSSGNIATVIDTSKSSHHPSLSPDGKVLAFVRGNGPHSDIFTLNLETGEERRLTTADSINEHPKWSPDGTRLVFRRLINHKSQICVMMVDSSNKEMITEGPGDFDPSWSPDGRLIAFVRLDMPVAKGGIYLITPEGANFQQLVQENDARAPAWSPDGTKILYQVGTNAEARIYQVDPDGNNKKELTKGVSPTWQPVFDDESDGASESGSDSLAIAD